ncbi:F-box/LRR-repeat protein [Hirschfeldia incana]|nr:F-box/LRR-repeat protein [Hirschfeldia incana]
MDRISNLPEALISHILSFLTTEESALTSVLSKKWRYLFADRPNLDFDGSVIRFHPETREWEMTEILRVFIRFVDRVLELQGNSTVDEFSLKCGRGVYPVCVTNWILNVLERGVSDLDLHFNLSGVSLPSKVFMSKSLVRLRIESENVIAIDMEDVCLPKLKTLYINKIVLGEDDDCFEKVTSGCRVLEELVLINVYSDFWNRSVSSKTLKSLILACCMEFDKNPDSISFDTPNVVYLEYSDYVAGKYPKVKFNSLVKASIDLVMTSEQHEQATYEHLMGDVTDFLMGIRNVQTLYISANTLEVLTFCCVHIPVFHNIIGLTIQSRKSGWESLPALLKKCPNLETLVFDGLSHSFTVKCMDVDGCLCKFSGEVPTCLSSSPVKVLKILRFGDNVEKEKDLTKHFLETMPRLEQLMIYYDTLFDDDVFELSSELKRFPTKASPICEIQVIFNNLSG